MNNAQYDIVDHNLPNHLVPIINGNSFNLEYDTGATIPDKFNTGQYHFTIRAKLTKDSPYVAQKQFNVIIKDISTDGSSYRLIIQNDSQSYDGNKNSYNNNAPIIHVQKIGIKDNEISISEETNISITTEIIDPKNPPGNLPDGLILYIPEGLFTGESLSKYDSPIELNNVTYQKGGYDIVLYYKGKKLELLGAEHIDCVKDGKDSDISDGITIKDTTRFYQATKDNNPYPQSHEGHENENDGWKSPQSEVKDWNASKPYLFIQDKTVYSNSSVSWGPVELYSYWGNENYDLTVYPQHLIFNEEVKKENDEVVKDENDKVVYIYTGNNIINIALKKDNNNVNFYINNKNATKIVILINNVQIDIATIENNQQGSPIIKINLKRIKKH